MTGRGRGITILARSFTDPDVQTLVAAIQAEYRQIYGGEDEGVVAGDDFAPGRGAFFVGYAGVARYAGATGYAAASDSWGMPVAMGGWRRLGELPGMPREGELTAYGEIKRMYVVPEQRSRGYARAMLQRLEAEARRAGLTHLVLETGDLQPHAVALYRSVGYADVDGSGFAHYWGSPHCVALGKALALATH